MKTTLPSPSDKRSSFVDIELKEISSIDQELSLIASLCFDEIDELSPEMDTLSKQAEKLKKAADELNLRSSSNKSHESMFLKPNESYERLSLNKLSQLSSRLLFEGERLDILNKESQFDSQPILDFNTKTNLPAMTDSSDKYHQNMLAKQQVKSRPHRKSSCVQSDTYSAESLCAIPAISCRG